MEFNRSNLFFKGNFSKLLKYNMMKFRKNRRPLTHLTRGKKLQLPMLSFFPSLVPKLEHCCWFSIKKEREGNKK